MGSWKIRDLNFVSIDEPVKDKNLIVQEHSVLEQLKVLRLGEDRTGREFQRMEVR